ncbi:MAG: glycosyltransferase family 9 protein [Marinagarivorans sp.]|nr:glycosyltransferase family 9 protein [Marinagarivorans sp.]
MNSIKSICILRLSAIGDVCHALAVVQAIAAHYPNTEITWVIGRVEAALFKHVPNIRFVVFDKKLGFGAYTKLRKDLPQRFDVLLHMQVALRANLAAACIKAKRKIGFAKHLSKEFHGLVINERAAAGPTPHVLEGFAAFAHAIGVPPFKPEWSIPVAVEDAQWAEQLITLHSPPSISPHVVSQLGAKKILVVSPAASKAERNWLPECYAAVMDYANQKGFLIFLTGGPSEMEQELATQIIAQCKSYVINLVGKSNLTQLLALLNKASIVLSPDSGPAHMATTQGVPVIGLYAHSNPARTGPYNSQAYVCEAYHAHLLAQTGKTFDALVWGKRVKGENLMADISVESVIKSFDLVCKNYEL